MVVDAKGNLLKELVVGASSRNDLAFGDVIWTGSNYLAGWQSGNSTGFYALIDPVGNLLGTHSVPGSAASDNTPVRVSANDTSLAAAWVHGTPSVVSLAVLNLAGGVAGTVDISSVKDSSPQLHGVAGVPGGHVVLWSHDNGTYATYVAALNGQPGALQTFVADPDHVPNYAKGATDGCGRGLPDPICERRELRLFER